MDTPEDTTITQLNISQSNKEVLDKVNSLKISSHALTDIGNKRTHNEDAFYCSDQKRLWFVADGIGGHNAGDAASQSLVDAISKFNPETHIHDSVDALEYIINQTNNLLIAKAKLIDDLAVIGSTIALLVTLNSKGVLLWAGDSRVYRIRANQIELLTHDHSLINEMVKNGDLDLNDVNSYPESNKITRAIGFTNNVKLDHRNLSILPGDRYVICSDGLTKYLDDEEILLTSEGESITNATQQMLRKALNAGGTDNITIITIEFNEG